MELDRVILCSKKIEENQRIQKNQKNQKAKELGESRKTGETGASKENKSDLVLPVAAYHALFSMWLVPDFAENQGLLKHFGV